MRVRISNRIPHIEHNGEKILLTLQEHTERTVKHILSNYWQMEAYGAGLVGVEDNTTLLRLLGHDLTAAMEQTLTDREKEILLAHFNEGYCYTEMLETYKFKSVAGMGLYVKRLVLLLSYFLERYSGWDKLAENN